ncbi:MAG: glycolate oxidase subunit GlcF [Methylohalobius sp.]|nr:glycolate oxidase subunit GlcF [Methylohalobius sp.]
MYLELASKFKNHPQAYDAAQIIRSCVHCGFCNATCPTFRVLGDELDGPRGRIYQIKSLLEGQKATVHIQNHLDRCLTCRGCETTCPAGVRFGRLLDLGRHIVEAQVKRPWRQRLLRWGLRHFVPYPGRIAPWVRLARFVRLGLPKAWVSRLPPPNQPIWPAPAHSRRMLVLDGCVQAVLAPQINAAAAKVLDGLGISLLPAPKAGCCGALSYHLGAQEDGLIFAKRNIDAWWPYVEQGIEAIVTTASGCGLMVKEYGQLLTDDPRYAEKASVVSALVKDICEVLAGLPKLEQFRPQQSLKIAFQSPCTLQHGLRLAGRVEELLQRLGYELAPVPDAHLCCGSAGAYSILESKIAAELRRAKIAALESSHPDLIATANIGCFLYLKPVATRPVIHWIELLAAGKAAG